MLPAKDLVLDNARFFSFRKQQPRTFLQVAYLYTDHLWEIGRLEPPMRVSAQYLKQKLDNRFFGSFVLDPSLGEVVASCGGGVVDYRHTLVLCADWFFVPKSNWEERRVSRERSRLLQFAAANMVCRHEVVYGQALQKTDDIRIMWRSVQGNTFEEFRWRNQRLVKVSG